MRRLRGVLWSAAAVAFGLAACRSLRVPDVDAGIEVSTPTTAVTVRRVDGTVAVTSVRDAVGGEFAAAGAAIPLPSGAAFGFRRAEPCAGGCRLVFADGDGRLEYVVSVIGGDRAGPCEFRAELVNRGDRDFTYRGHDLVRLTLRASEATRLMKVARESGVAEGVDAHASRFPGTGLTVVPVTDGTVLTARTNGHQNWNANGDFPMIYAFDPRAGAYLALEWTEGFVEARCEGSSRVRYAVAMGRGDEFSTVLGPGGRLVLPTVYAGTFTGSLDDGSNAFKRWYLNVKAPRNLVTNDSEPLLQMDMQRGLEVGEWGVESIKWDYGWWSPDFTAAPWKSLEGSWRLRAPGYIGVLQGYGCTNIAEFAAKARERGLSLAVYVLWHDTCDAGQRPIDTEGEFNSITHPEWFSDRRVAGGMGRSADLGEPRCVDYLKRAMLAFFRDNGITTWRSDFEPICISSNLANRHAADGRDVLYWNSVGFGEVLSYLIANYSGFRYESCCSGGAMKGFYTGRFASSFNTDDSANYLSLRASFYDSSYCLHPVQLQQPGNPDCFIFGRKGFYPAYDAKDAEAVMHMGMRSHFLTGVNLGSWTGDLSEPIPTLYARYYRLFASRLRPLVRKGGLYHILPRPDGRNWDGVMYADPEADGMKGAAFLFKPSERAPTVRRVKFAGLNAAKTYGLEFEDRREQNRILPATVLMDEGVDVSIDGVGSEIIWFREIQ